MHRSGVPYLYECARAVAPLWLWIRPSSHPSHCRSLTDLSLEVSHGAGTCGVEQPPESRQRYCSPIIFHATAWTWVRLKILWIFDFFFGWKWQMSPFILPLFYSTQRCEEADIPEPATAFLPPKDTLFLVHGLAVILLLSSTEVELWRTSVANSTGVNCRFRLCWGLLGSSIIQKSSNELHIDSIIGVPPNLTKHTKLYSSILIKFFNFPWS